jgi:hypothetical protein
LFVVLNFYLGGPLPFILFNLPYANHFSILLIPRYEVAFGAICCHASLGEVSYSVYEALGEIEVQLRNDCYTIFDTILIQNS